tara:strand:- start:535 stop:1272 length:738 start_codon:yes stop_codon:yes gene_type:complete
MARVNAKKLKIIKQNMALAKNKEESFKTFISANPKPDPDVSDPKETIKGVTMVRNMIKEGHNIYDVLNDYGKGAISSSDDTHSAPRKWEKWLGGRGDGDPKPDTKHSEIKLNEVDQKHELPKANPVLNIGAIQPKKVDDYKCFEESSCYKKMKNMWITTHSNNYKKIEGTFVFEVDNSLWFDRVKEDYEFFHNLYTTRRDAGLRSSKSSIVSSSTPSPNGTLQVRSDAIMFSRDFFREVSKYYDK